jgi:putative glutathione S-transferase
MSLMINGQLKNNWLDAELADGEFIREDSQFRHWITADGSPGPTGKGGFKAQADRYHLYVSLACPWAHRTLIFRQLKQLQDLVTVSIVHPHMGDKGWHFGDFPGSTRDHLYGSKYMHQLYTRAQADYSGIVTVPVLWDKKLNTIVNNESSEIIRMFNSAFDDLTGSDDDYYPHELRADIDSINTLIYDSINNGVYKTGFATTQQAYDKACMQLFDALDTVEQRLENSRYLVGDRLTEADWRLFTTLIRFDAVYFGHFKCNIRRIEDYPSLSNYLRELYQVQGMADTVNMHQIQQHYYYSHDSINPARIVPRGPQLNFNRPHDRANS